MKTLRLASQTALMAVLSATLIISPIALTGCSSAQVQDTIAVAAQVATSAAGIVGPVSPQIAALLNEVGSALKDTSALYAAYVAAAAADKPGIAGKLHAILSTTTANLQTILADAHIKAPELVEYISVGVAVINSAVLLILTHIPPAPNAVRANAQALPHINAKSAGDLANAWNNAIGVQYPQAVVNAPKHKRLGVF